MSIPYPTIQETQDRSWTLRLLDRLRLPDLTEDERGEILETLSRLADPRATAKLTGILENRDLPSALREDAGQILRNTGNPPGGARLRAWWIDGDIVIQRHALRSMGHAEADLVEPIARDPAHPLHREAISTMEWGFEEPRFQALKIAALGHADPLVREVAADVLRWDEPVVAEEPLLRATADPVAEVVAAALKTLGYYPSRRCLRAVHSLRDHVDDRIRAEAEQCVLEIRFTCRSALRHGSPGERSYLRAWMDPVWELLDLSEEDLAPPEPSAAPEPKPVTAPAPSEGLTADELMTLYSDPDGPWAEKLALFPRRGEAARYAADRARLIRFFLGHADPGIREQASWLFSGWDEHEALIELCRDPAFLVRKSAMYNLGQTSPNAALSVFIWEHLGDPGTTSTHAYETLNTYIVHAPRTESIPRLVDLVRADARESVRYHAIYGLAKPGAAAEIEGLLPLLEEPPRLTWSIHAALLDACKKLSLRPGGLGALQGVDNVDVQAAIAPFLCGS